jgi:hypothetical protein
MLIATTNLNMHYTSCRKRNKRKKRRDIHTL